MSPRAEFNVIPRHCRVFLAVLLCLVLLFPPASRAYRLKEHSRLWLNGIITGTITKDEKWNYYIEPQLRFLDDKYKFNTANLLLALFYQPTDAWSFYLGVFRLYGIRSNGTTYQEYRLWQQAIWNMAYTPCFDLLSRTRLEERKNFSKPQIANRLRQRFALQIPINAAKDHFLVLAEEIFLQFNKPSWVTNRTFAQNRASIGILFPFGKESTCEAGYLNQFEYGKPNQMSNVLYITYARDLG